MAKAKFESYVEERIAELAAAKRAKLKAAYDAEVKKVEKQRDKYLKMLEDDIKVHASKIIAQAKKDGCVINECTHTTDALSEFAKNILWARIGIRTEYDREALMDLWPEGTPVRKAQDDLRSFNALCKREAKRITVYKMDLGMKSEAFEKLLAEAAAKINKE